MKDVIKLTIACILGFAIAAGAGKVETLFQTPNLHFGGGFSGTKDLIFDIGNGTGANPTIASLSGQLQFANDGVTFSPFSAGVPSGAMSDFAGQSAPTGWVLTDGTCYSRTSPTYTALYAVIGVTYGICDGMTTFQVPDLRGISTRFPNDSSGLDPDVASRGSYAGGTFGGTHTFTGTTHGTTTVDGISSSDFANLAVGMGLEGSGITGSIGSNGSASTFIVALNPPSAITISIATSNSTTEVITSTNSASGPYPGSYQADQFASHNHSSLVYTDNATQGAFIRGTNGGGGVQGSETTSSTGGNETRGKNMYFYKIIKL